MLKATCDLRLPATLASDEIVAIGSVIPDALDHATAHRREERRQVG